MIGKTVATETPNEKIVNSFYQSDKLGLKGKIKMKMQVSFGLLLESLTCSLSDKVIYCSKEIMVLRNFYRKCHHHQPKVPLNRSL